ncbi:MAG: DUF3426 domain-containing protein [Betaproteobacteria bacterium]|nr:DUF3426 domain-containing protein [Betaproteobacteria bacterium]
MSGMKNSYPGSGTTLCPHCGARFKITGAQLEAHHGMVRCGHCLQAFDTRPNFAPEPEQLDLHLELPILDELVAQTEQPPAEESRAPETPPPARIAVLKPMTLAEQVVIVQDRDDSESRPEHHTWPWAMAALLLLLALLAQAAYFFRVDLAARLPGLKPALLGYCRLLKCSVPLPKKTDLIGIESSDLEADPAHANQITLNALLRNRAVYAQAFPNLELTLNDSQDKPLARRIFRPADYLPVTESETTGLLPNRELGIRLRLNTTGLRPMGYRLVLFYPNNY